MNNENQNPEQAIAAIIKDSSNILVTVSTNPSVDQLAACMGLTLWLNHIDKHATAVFSGDVPSTLEFLKPAATLEKNTDSLRDFIISLDKTKADKLRYKVEDSVVKVFVTPYRTTLTADDLEFSQGDFNIDLVIALGVNKQSELDVAITSHGRILHDATVSTITIGENPSELGSIGWHDQQASSLSELIVDLVNSIDKEKMTGQIATALLTGVVAETERFSNSKTTPQTMSVSAQLMSAGADQQLVATKLDEPEAESPDLAAQFTESLPEPPTPTFEDEAKAANRDGTLTIGHEDAERAPEVTEQETPVATAEPAPESESDTGPEPAAELPSPEQSDQPNFEEFLKTSESPQPAEEVVQAEETPQPEDTTDTTQVEEPPHKPEDITITPPTPQQSIMQPAPPSWLPQQPWMQPTSSAETAPAEQPQPVIDSRTSEPEIIQPDPTNESTSPFANPPTQPTPAPAAPVSEQQSNDLDAARNEVMKAMEATPPEPAPAAAEAPSSEPESPASSTAFNPAAFGIVDDPESSAPQPADSLPQAAADVNTAVDPSLTGPVDQALTLPTPPPSPLTPPPADPTPPTSAEFDPTAPPPVPPPMPFSK